MASQFNELVEAIAQTKGQLVANRFSEEDLKKLWDNGYQAAVDLQRATRDSLLEIGLLRARVDALIGTSVAGGLPSQPRDQIAAALQKKLPSPSSYAKNNPSSGWSDTKLAHLLPYMGMHRPGFLPGTRFEQLPVSLLDPNLAKIEEDCAYGEPTQIDVGAAHQLMTEMSGSFADEKARLEAFWRWAAVHLGLHFDRVTFRGSETDGTALISTPHFNALGANLDVKLDIGTGGGDPHVQNTAYAALANSDEARKEVRRLSRCPALLLQLAGPNLSLSGFAFGEAPFCDQLSHTVSLLWQSGSELLVGVTRLVLAVRTGWQRLQEFYINLGADFTRWSQSTPAQRELFEQPFPKAYPDLFTRPLPLLQLEYPYPRSYGDPPTGFTYVERLSRLTFLAKSMSGSQNVVKFCKRYSAAAHKVLEVAGYAPALLGHERLPGPWQMVIMEYLDSASTWDDSMRKPLDELCKAVETLHKADFVHGDLRPPNILVQNDKVHIVDFEWAGPAAEAAYPLFMNTSEIVWPDGASDGKPILKEHDKWFLDRLCAAA